MTDNKEGQTPTPPEYTDKERANLLLWKDIIYKQAYDLLGKYLPEAQPQEPSDIWFTNYLPSYRAKYKGVHHVAGVINPKQLGDLMRSIEKLKHIGEKDWEEPIHEEEDWEHPERLLAGINQYSLDSWGNVYILIHELIHQRQAELHPASFPVISDSEGIPDEELGQRLLAANQAWHRGGNTLFESVIEGMAVLGTYYVAGRFLDDLIKTGESDTADKIKIVRNETVSFALRPQPTGSWAEFLNEYSPYRDGLRMMIKLYKKFGIENTPGILTSVDLKACKGIKRDSPAYQQAMENPALLPGLPKVA